MLSHSNQLLIQAEAFKQPHAGRVTAMRDLQQPLADATFPCIFSRNAFKKELIRFAFVEDCTSSHLRDLGAALTDYVDLSRDWDGRIETAYPLIVLFSSRAVSERTVTATNYEPTNIYPQKPPVIESPP